MESPLSLRACIGTMNRFVLVLVLVLLLLEAKPPQSRRRTRTTTRMKGRFMGSPDAFLTRIGTRKLPGKFKALSPASAASAGALQNLDGVRSVRLHCGSQIFAVLPCN